MKALQIENCSRGEREKKERREVREGAPAVFPGEAVPAAVLLLGALSPRRHPPPRRVRGGRWARAGAALAPSRAQAAARTHLLGGSCFSESLNRLLLALNGAYSHYKPTRCCAKAAVWETWCHINP